MKLTNSIFLSFSLAFLMVNCKSQEQVEVNKISGGWKIAQVTYAQRGSSSPDSTVSYEKSTFDFGSCQLTASNRECFGYYSLNGLDRTAVTYSISGDEKRLNLAAVDQNNRKGIELNGSFSIEQSSNSTLILSGPAGYVDKNGQFRLQALDVRLTLTR